MAKPTTNSRMSPGAPAEAASAVFPVDKSDTMTILRRQACIDGLLQTRKVPRDNPGTMRQSHHQLAALLKLPANQSEQVAFCEGRITYQITMTR
jgi:hypothetical protein